MNGIGETSEPTLTDAQRGATAHGRDSTYMPLSRVVDQLVTGWLAEHQIEVTGSDRADVTEARTLLWHDASSLPSEQVVWLSDEVRRLSMYFFGTVSAN